MKISVFGLGYVGTVTSACLAKRGHTIIGVDVQPPKVDLFNRGQPPIVEPGVEGLLRQAREAGRLRATADCPEAVAATELSLICVGTPSSAAGDLDMGIVRQVVQEIGEALRRRPQRHVLVLRSTLLPGSTAALVKDRLADLHGSGQLPVYYYPEFLREGTAVADFENPSLAMVGTADGAPPPPALTAALFGAEAVSVSWATAELVKCASNAFHATKVVFANELGRLAKGSGIDAREVMELLCRDTRLNISPAYLRPGNPFGGSCLPKDVRALAHRGRVQGLHLPLLEGLLPSNERHLQALLGTIVQTGAREVVILGLAFKAETDDLRDSAMVEVAQTLLGRGYQVRIHDPGLNLAALTGSNRRLAELKMPHLGSYLYPDLATAVGEQGLIVVAQRCVSVAALARVVTARHRVLDVNGWPELQRLPSAYEGFCW